MIRNYRGVNRRDGGERVLDNQFYSLQNVYPATKGLLYKRSGTTYDTQVSASIPLCASISAIHRVYDSLGNRFTLHHCLPDATSFPAPSVAPTVTENSTGDLFDGGAVVAITFSYSWVGAGCESAKSAGTAFTASANTKGAIITIPAFPSGVRSANVFMTIGADITPIGVITTSAGSLTHKYFRGPLASFLDSPGVVYEGSNGAVTAGSLKKGTYYLTCVPHAVSGGVQYVGMNSTTVARNYITVRLDDDNQSIKAYTFLAGSVTANGARYVHWFIGTKPPTEAPMTWVGITAISNTSVAASVAVSQMLVVSSIPKSINLQTYLVNFNVLGVVTTYNGIYTNELGYTGVTTRVPFLIRKDSDGTFSEVHFARRNLPGYDPYDCLAPLPTDKYKFRFTTSLVTPVFDSFLGLTFIANGAQPMVQTDGITMQEMVPFAGTNLPGPPTFVGHFKDQLICTVATYKNQVFGSNAYAWSNWSDGGTGTSLRFITVGDPFGDSVKVCGAFSYTTGTDGPLSFLVALKKAACWVTTNIPNATSGVRSSMNQLSGKVGCIAAKTAVQTPSGFMFLGSDGYLYLSRGSGEPFNVGGSVQPILNHLTTNDTLMSLCTASFHDGFYKLSYPSSSTSTTNDAQLWADMRNQDGSPIDWSGPHTGVGIVHDIVLLGEADNSGRLGLLAGGSATIVLDDTSTFQDLGTTISSMIQSKTYRMRAEMHFKRFMGMLFDLYYDTQYAHTVLMEAFSDANYTQESRDLSTGAAVWDSSSFDTTGLWGDAMFQPVPWMFGDTNLVGRTFYWKLTHANNAQFILAASGIIFKPERRQIVS